MRSKKTLNEELYRINQIMVNSSSDILLEQAEAKIINKVLDDAIKIGIITEQERKNIWHKNVLDWLGKEL